MTTFVLLHGAWHGGWCWARVRSRLEAAGHRTFAPTFTGLSDRGHLLSPAVGLETHVEDVVRLMEAEDLRDVIMVGHSYAGMVLSVVAGRIPERIAHRVHVEAFVPSDGDAAIDLLPETVARHYRDSVAGPGFGWLIPVRSLEVLGVTAELDLAWLGPRLTPQPWRTYTDAARLDVREADLPSTFIEGTDWMRVFRPHAARARERGWRVCEISSGHELMVTAAEALTDILIMSAGLPA